MAHPSDLNLKRLAKLPGGALFRVTFTIAYRTYHETYQGLYGGIAGHHGTTPFSQSGSRLNSSGSRMTWSIVRSRCLPTPRFGIDVNNPRVYG